jgi:UDP-N-acetylmuramate dehydrogenase
VHHRQALVLVNRGGATGQEVMHLAEQICQSVKKQFGVEIHPEVNYVMG